MQGQKRKAQVEEPEDFQKPAKIKRRTHEAVAEAKLTRVRRRAATGRSIVDNPPAEEPAVEKPAVEKPAIDQPITEQLAREPLPKPLTEESAVTILTVAAPTVQGPLGPLVEEPVAEEQPAPEEEPAVGKPTEKGVKAKETQTEAAGKPKAKRGQKRKVTEEMASTAEPVKGKARRRTEKKATAGPEKRLHV
jgi:hypothetical protein